MNRKSLEREIETNKINRIEIKTIEYHYKYAGVVVSGECFNGSEKVDGYEFFSSLAEVLRNEIKKGGHPNGSGDMSAKKLVKILSGIDVFMLGEKIEESSWLSVETGTDS